MRNGVRNLITDVPGLRVGNAQDAGLRSGSTVLLADRPFVAAVSLMGGAPGTGAGSAASAGGSLLTGGIAGGIGVIGCGNFASRVLVPELRRQGSSPSVFASANGLSAKLLAGSAATATTDVTAVLDHAGVEFEAPMWPASLGFEFRAVGDDDALTVNLAAVFGQGLQRP